MKPFYFHWRGHRYKLQPAGILLIVVVLIIAICLLLLPLINRSRETAVKPAAATAQPSYDAAANAINVSEYEGTILGPTADAGQSYIDSTLFLGDSNTARFMRITSDNGSTFTTKNNTIGVVGMGIDAISSLRCMQFSTGTFTMPEAVKILQPQRILITFGTNNLNGSSTDATSFIDRYSAQIQAVADAYPSADIIINSIPPVAKRRSYPNVTMTQIDAYNKAIATMCQQKNWKYLNSAETLKDSASGYAKEGYTISDGLHLSNQGLTALFSYIRTHAWITDDDRPKPLAAIPTIIGVPDGLIRTDPLTDSAFTEDPASEGDTSTQAGCQAAYGTWDANNSVCTWPAPSTAPTATTAPTTQPVITPEPAATNKPVEPQSPVETTVPSSPATPSPTETTPAAVSPGPSSSSPSSAVESAGAKANNGLNEEVEQGEQSLSTAAPSSTVSSS